MRQRSTLPLQMPDIIFDYTQSGITNPTLNQADRFELSLYATRSAMTEIRGGHPGFASTEFIVPVRFVTATSDDRFYVILNNNPDRNFFGDLYISAIYASDETTVLYDRVDTRWTGYPPLNAPSLTGAYIPYQGSPWPTIFNDVSSNILNYNRIATVLTTGNNEDIITEVRRISLAVVEPIRLRDVTSAMREAFAPNDHSGGPETPSFQVDFPALRESIVGGWRYASTEYLQQFNLYIRGEVDTPPETNAALLTGRTIRSVITLMSHPPFGRLHLNKNDINTFDLEDANCFSFGIDNLYSDLIVADINGDGLDDMFLYNKDLPETSRNECPSHTAAVYLSRGFGVFTHAICFGSQQSLGKNKLIILRDFNGDGKADIFAQNGDNSEDSDCASYGAAIYLSQGNGMFSVAKCFDKSLISHDHVNMIPIEFNNDGYSDFIMQTDDFYYTNTTCSRYGAGSLGLWASNGKDNFDLLKCIAASFVRGVITILTGNIDNDGRPDIIGYSANAFSNWGCDIGSLGIYKSKDFYTQIACYSALGKAILSSFMNLLIADVNGDGYDDIVIQQEKEFDILSTKKGQIIVLLNNHVTDESFTAIGTGFIAPLDLDAKIFVSNFNYNNKTEIFVQGGVEFDDTICELWAYGNLAFLEYKGNELFDVKCSNVGMVGGFVYPYVTFKLADINGDGAMDLIFQSNSNEKRFISSCEDSIKFGGGGVIIPMDYID